MNSEMRLRVLKALADPTRLQIVEMLATCCCAEGVVSDEGEIEEPSAGEICCRITGADKINSTISHHLHELEGAKLIVMEKRGKRTVCRLNTDTVLDISMSLGTLVDRRLRKISEACV